MELSKAKEIANALVKMLDGACERIEIAGSIRRLKPDVGDVELLCIPKIDDGVDQLDRRLKGMIQMRILDYRLNKRGSKVYGPQNKLLIYRPAEFGVDIFSTTEENWWVSLVVRTGGKTTNQRISMAAIDKGLRFHAYGRGFSSPQGEIVCSSEREVFETVGLPYLPPEKRE